MERSFNSLDDFYYYYLAEHLDRKCRALHFIGTTLVIALVIAGVVTQVWWLFAITPLAGYGFAWMGHFIFEKNRPAAFRNPLWSLASDFIMYWHTITFQLADKLAKAKKMYA